MEGQAEGEFCAWLIFLTKQEGDFFLCVGFLNFPLEKLYKVCMKMLSGLQFPLQTSPQPVCIFSLSIDLCLSGLKHKFLQSPEYLLAQLGFILEQKVKALTPV